MQTHLSFLATLGLNAQKELYVVCRVDNFVNGLDIVPRLLGKALKRTHGLVWVLKKAGRMPEALTAWLTTAANYQPFGYFHLLVDGSLTTVDSSLQEDSLQYSWCKVFDLCCHHLGSGLIHMHGMLSYQQQLSLLLQQPQLSSADDLQIVSKSSTGTPTASMDTPVHCHVSMPARHTSSMQAQVHGAQPLQVQKHECCSSHHHGL